MTSYLDALRSAIDRVSCTIGNSTERAGELVDNAVYRTSGGLVPEGAIAWGPTQIRDFLCGEGGANDPPAETFSSPGLCDLVLYSIDLEFERNDGNVQTIGPIGGIRGPISGTQINPINGGSGTSIVVFCRGRVGSTSVLPPNSPVALVNAPNEIYVRAELAEIVRQDGQPDDCDPNPGYRLPVEWGDADGNPQSDDYVFRPGIMTVEPSGNISLPIQVSGPIVEFGALVNVESLEIDIFGGGSGLPPVCLPVPLPDLPVDIIPDFPDAPPPFNDERQFTGVIIYSTINSPGRATEVSELDKPSLFIPDLGTLRFAIRIGRETAWTQDYRIKSLKQYIDYNGEGLPYDYVIISDQDVSFDVRPIFVDPDPGN